jgi:hypothetical protein
MDTSSLDLSKLVSVIMENPEIITAIKNLAQGAEKQSTDMEFNDNDIILKSDSEPTSATEEDTKSEPDEPSEPTVTYQRENLKNNRRATLMQALKPYVSKERAKAIDTMMSFAEVFKLMRE